MTKKTTRIVRKKTAAHRPHIRKRSVKKGSRVRAQKAAPARKGPTAREVAGKNAHQVMESMLPGAFFIVENGLIRYLTPASTHVLGYLSPETLVNVPFLDVLAPGSRRRVTETLSELMPRQRSTLPVRLKRTDGTKRDAEMTVGLIVPPADYESPPPPQDKEEDLPAHFFVQATDLEAQMETYGTTRQRRGTAGEERRCPFTNMPGPKIFNQELDRAIARAVEKYRRFRKSGKNAPQEIREKYHFMVICLILDSLGETRQAQGEGGYRSLLKGVSQRIRESLRKEDFVAHTSPGYFMMIVEGLENLDDISVVARKLLGSVEAPLTYQESLLEPRARIGISLYPDHGRERAKLIQAARKTAEKLTFNARERFRVHRLATPGSE